MKFIPARSVLHKVFSSLVFRVAVLVCLLFLAPRLPRWAGGIAWGAFFAAGVWMFCALTRESRGWADFVVPRLVSNWARLALWNARFVTVWKHLGTLLAMGVLLVALWRAWPVWNFMAESSLREDEIGSIAGYSAKGFPATITTYRLAKNHVFFNAINALLPGADSMFPLRARAVSFLAVAGALVVLIFYAAMRGWLLAGAVCAGLLAVNVDALKVLLEARGYGLLFLLAMGGCVAFAEWLRTRRRFWLSLLILTCVLGTYTLPYYLVFGGSLLVAAFFHSPSRETFLAGIWTGIGVLIVYLPILARVHEVFSGYSDKYGVSSTAVFATTEGTLFSVQYFLSREWIQIAPLSFAVLVLALLLYAGFGRFAHVHDRVAVAGVLLAVLGMLIFWLCVVSVPIRVAAFLGAPYAFLGTLVLGSSLAARALDPLRPLPSLLLATLAVFLISKPWTVEALLPRQDWWNLAQVMERGFSPETKVWVNGGRGRLFRSHVGSKQIADGEALDSSALSEGGLVALESVYRGGDEDIFLRREQLPEDVRFVTAPLMVGYQRLFFPPPTPGNGVSVFVDGRPVAGSVPGSQAGDPGVLAESLGHGDYLARQPETRPRARPEELPLPVTVTVELGGRDSPGHCNFLFSQGLGDKAVSVEFLDASGQWRKSREVFVLSEFLSIPIPDSKVQSLRFRVESKAAPIGGNRPPFGILAAWFKAG
jgi:hypothetical protein